MYRPIRLVKKNKTILETTRIAVNACWSRLKQTKSWLYIYFSILWTYWLCCLESGFFPLVYYRGLQKPFNHSKCKTYLIPTTLFSYCLFTSVTNTNSSKPLLSRLSVWAFTIHVSFKSAIIGTPGLGINRGMHSI